MSSEKNPEVVGCDASIMRNVWEIREREYDQKMQLELQRQEKSALPSINQDWANRLAARQGQYKRVERKAKTEDSTADNTSVPKTKRPPVQPHPAPHASRPAPPTRRTTPQRGSAAQAKDKKGHGKLDLIRHIGDTQPSAMVWGKSWKFNKSLSQQQEGPFPSDWGHCWMFLTQQPYTEAGKPWPNGPCKINPAMLHLCDKPVFRVPESEPLIWSLSNDEWNMSWSNANKKKGSSSGEGTEAKYGFFASLVESHHHNNNLYSSEWRDGWKSSKPQSESLFSTEETGDKKQDHGKELSPEWGESWKLINHHGLNKITETRQSHSPEWVNSWRAAMMVQDNHNKSGSSEKKGQKGQGKEFMFSGRNKAERLFSDLNKEIKNVSEWNKSWLVAKNNTKPSAEIDKTLKTEPPRIDNSLKGQERSVSAPTSEQASKFTQLRNMVLSQPKREMTHSVLLRFKHLEKASTGSEWRDSWKMLKHQLRRDQRMRCERLQPFDEKKERMRPSGSEWKNSWKFTNPPFGQNADMWQQQWTTTPQIRVNRAREYNHFAPVELPKNGPTGERPWNESWRFSRHQRTTSQRNSASTSQSPTTSWQPQRGGMRAPGDWQEAWMVSETQYRHDTASFPQWMEAWRCSFQTGNHPFNEQLASKQRLSDSLEIKRQKEIISVQNARTKISRSFEQKIFQERYPEKQWIDSWKDVLFLKQCANDGNANTGVSSEYGCKYGMSFRLANPMPKTDTPWVKSAPKYPGSSYPQAMWSRPKKKQTYINRDFTNNPRIMKLWPSSQQFLQQFSTKPSGSSKSFGPTDPRVIIMKNFTIKKHLYIHLERKEKQPDKKWAGCHLLGKTQPRPKRGAGATKKIKLEGESEDTFIEEWAESWKFYVCMNGLKTKSVKSLRGWEEAWKFLLPPYQTQNGPKTR